VGLEIARECIGPETWPEARQAEFARNIGTSVGGRMETRAMVFLEALCAEHACIERALRGRLQELLEQQSGERGRTTYNEYIEVGRAAGLALKGHTSPIVKAANALWETIALNPAQDRVYRLVPWEIIIAALQTAHCEFSIAMRQLLCTPVEAVSMVHETGLRPVGNAAMMSHVRSRWMAAAPGLDKALATCKRAPPGVPDPMEEVELLRMRFLSVINCSFGSAALAAELYARLLYTSTACVLENGKAKKVTVTADDIKSGESTDLMRAAEDMASLVLSQHVASHEPAPVPTFSFGADSQFHDGIKKGASGVLFQVRGKERHRRHEVQDFRHKALSMLGTREPLTAIKPPAATPTS